MIERSASRAQLVIERIHLGEPGFADVTSARLFQHPCKRTASRGREWQPFGFVVDTAGCAGGGALCHCLIVLENGSASLLTPPHLHGLVCAGRGVPNTHSIGVINRQRIQLAQHRNTCCKPLRINTGFNGDVGGG